MTIRPPLSRVDHVTEILHGVAVEDPYRWLEDGSSQETIGWLAAQHDFCRAYLDALRGRENIEQRVRQLLDVERIDSVHQVGDHLIYRKRLQGQEQPCVFIRKGFSSPENLLIDPHSRKQGNYISVAPLLFSPDGKLMLYEIKRGGERTACYEIMEIASGRILPDRLEPGLLRGFAFTPANDGFYYSHEPLSMHERCGRGAYYHSLGTPFAADQKVLEAGTDRNTRVCLFGSSRNIGILVYRFLNRVHTDFYLKPYDTQIPPQPILTDVDYFVGPVFAGDRILALTNRNATNLCIAELAVDGSGARWIELIPQIDRRIQQWLVTSDKILIRYVYGTETDLRVFDLNGHSLGSLPVASGESARLLTGTAEGEVLIEIESLFQPPSIRCYGSDGRFASWSGGETILSPTEYYCEKSSYTSRDGTIIPVILAGRQDILGTEDCPAILSAYGGYGLAMTPRFSIFVAILLELGCLFALPLIRGGAEFGSQWHEAAKRKNRQRAFDDFLCAAEWLVTTKRTRPDKLAIYGGSNAGLLVAASMTQRPELFAAVLCLNPLLDMLRYHKFDGAQVWADEFGCSDDRDDFIALRNYSPYHNVDQNTVYPATMIVSGDADTNCNPLHARKMVARLQACTRILAPILLDYNPRRGHSPVMPVSERVRALTDRLAFVCKQLGVPIQTEKGTPCRWF